MGCFERIAWKAVSWVYISICTLVHFTSTLGRCGRASYMNRMPVNLWNCIFSEQQRFFLTPVIVNPKLVGFLVGRVRPEFKQIWVKAKGAINTKAQRAPEYWKTHKYKHFLEDPRANSYVLIRCMLPPKDSSRVSSPCSLEPVLRTRLLHSKAATGYCSHSCVDTRVHVFYSLDFRVAPLM